MAEPRFDALSPGKRNFGLAPARDTLAAGPAVGQPGDVDPPNWRLVIVRRLKPGTTRDEAQAAVSTIFHSQMTGSPKRWVSAAFQQSALRKLGDLVAQRVFFSTPHSAMIPQDLGIASCACPLGPRRDSIPS